MGLLHFGAFKFSYLCPLPCSECSTLQSLSAILCNTAQSRVRYAISNKSIKRCGISQLRVSKMFHTDGSNLSCSSESSFAQLTRAVLERICRNDSSGVNTHPVHLSLHQDNSCPLVERYNCIQAISSCQIVTQARCTSERKACTRCQFRFVLCPGNRPCQVRPIHPSISSGSRCAVCQSSL